MFLEQLKKYWKFHQGPQFEIGDRVLLTDTTFLKLPRKIAAIGWNNTDGYYFYAIAGIKNQLFIDSDLIDYNYTKSHNVLRFTKSEEKFNA